MGLYLICRGKKAIITKKKKKTKATANCQKITTIIVKNKTKITAYFNVCIHLYMHIRTRFEFVNII